MEQRLPKHSPAHRRLRAWQRAMDLAESVLELTDRFPVRERFHLSDQARRAAVSVAANIAEGVGQASAASVARYLAIARGSLNELDSHLALAQRRGWITAEAYESTEALLNEVLNLVGGLRRWTLRHR